MADEPPAPANGPPDAVVGALMASGFPFQTAVAHAIIAAAPQWKLYASEYAWKTARGEAHFLDLIATNGPMYLTIECKKTRKDAFNFLLPLGRRTTGLVDSFRCLHPQHQPGHTEVYCETWALYPRSNISEFCVVSSGDARKDQRLLERDAALLIGATDAFAHELKRRPLSERCLVIPVIVTNVPIFTTTYDPRKVSFETGEFASPPKDITRTSCARFEKHFPSESIRDLGDRTVFIVNALAFAEFLSLLDYAPNQPDRGEQVPVIFQRRSDLR